MLQQFSSLKNNQPQVHNNLGNALQDQGDLTAAITSYNNALQFKPNYSEAHYNLGNALQEQGNLTAAVASYRTALQLNQDFPDAHNNLGRTLHLKGELTAALFHHQKALELDPRHSNATYSIGLLQACKGNIQESKLLFHKALELNQNNTAALFELSKNLQSIAESQELAQKIDEINRTNLKKKDKSMLEFAAANVYHKSKEFTKASYRLKQANQLKLSYQKSDINIHLALTFKTPYKQDKLPKENQLMEQTTLSSEPQMQPLLESVLITNSNILDLGESKALSEAFYQIQDRPDEKESFPPYQMLTQRLLDFSRAAALIASTKICIILDLLRPSQEQCPQQK